MLEKDLSKIERRKKNRYSFYLDEADKKIFLEKVEKEKTTIQKFLYKKVFADEIEQSRDFLELAYQIRKIGVTLNQYLKLIYAGQSVQDSELMKELEGIKKALEDFKKRG